MARRKGAKKVAQPEFSEDEDYKKGASVNRWETENDIEMDSEDEFHKQRETVDLEDDFNENGDSDNEQENEEVFGLNVESDEDEDEDEDLGIYSVQNNDDIIEKKQYRELDEKAWGQRRNMYYNADDADADDEIAKEEEKEAIRLQQERMEQLDEDDFLDDSFATKLSTGASGETDKFDLDEDDDKNVEVLEKTSKENISKMTKDEQLSIIFNQTPEMLELIEEYKERLTELKDKIIPILDMIEKSGTRTKLEEKAIKYLKLKYQILISYLTNISFYLVLRSSISPNEIKDHPVIVTLVDIKLILDKIEKEVEGKEEEEEEEEIKSKKNKKKKSKKEVKPKEKTIVTEAIERLLQQVKEGRPDEEDSITDEHNDIINKMQSKLEQIQSAFSEEKINNKAKESIMASKDNKDKKSKKHVKISEDVEEISDSDYEERFVSLKPKEKPKKKSKRKEKNLNDFGESNDNLVDVEEKESKKKSLRFHVSRIDKSISKLTNKKSYGDLDVPYKTKDKKEIANDVKKSREVEGADVFDDTDDLDLNDGLDVNTNLNTQSNNKRPRDEMENDNDYIDDFDDEDIQYYEQVNKKIKEKKKMKEEAFRSEKQHILEESMYDENDLTPGEKRHINKTIEVNRGLTPHRKREKKNPRVKHRKNYEKAMIKLKSFRRVAVNKGEVGPYGGETTGIKTKLSRSVHFTN